MKVTFNMDRARYIQSLHSKPDLYNVYFNNTFPSTPRCHHQAVCFLLFVLYLQGTSLTRWSQWPSGLRRRSAAAHLLRSWVRIPPGAWMFFCCECCVLSGRGLCDELITRPEESYRLWCFVVCDLETSRMRRP